MYRLYMMFPSGNALAPRRDLAYTPRAIGFHTDNPYRDPTPVPRRLFGAGEAMMHSVLKTWRIHGLLKQHVKKKHMMFVMMFVMGFSFFCTALADDVCHGVDLFFTALADLLLKCYEMIYQLKIPIANIL